MPFVHGRLAGWYATVLHQEASQTAHEIRDGLRKLRRKQQPRRGGGLVPIHWQCRKRTNSSIRLAEPRKCDGNVTLVELTILSQLANSLAYDGGYIFEIGTFDGRTALNLAINAPEHQVRTLDLPGNSTTVYPLSVSDRQYTEKPASGWRIGCNRFRYPAAVARVKQLYGDSAAFDFARYRGRCDLVFVDGAHTFDYVINDSRVAEELCSAAGIIVWHDYGVWGDVTRALDHFAAVMPWRLVHVRRTSLVIGHRLKSKEVKQ